MPRFRSYWIYSAGLALVWEIMLILVFTLRGPAMGQVLLWIFAGYCIGGGCSAGRCRVRRTGCRCRASARRAACRDG